MKTFKDIVLYISIVCCTIDIIMVLEKTYNEFTILALGCFAIYFPIEISTRLINKKNNYD